MASASSFKIGINGAVTSVVASDYTFPRGYYELGSSRLPANVSECVGGGNQNRNTDCDGDWVEMLIRVYAGYDKGGVTKIGKDALDET
jgi:hypothetical protein